MVAGPRWPGVVHPTACAHEGPNLVLAARPGPGVVRPTSCVPRLAVGNGLQTDLGECHEYHDGRPARGHTPDLCVPGDLCLVLFRDARARGHTPDLCVPWPAGRNGHGKRACPRRASRPSAGLSGHVWPIVDMLNHET